jgi:cytochrome c biogenesis factor|tara:strand:+ start:525 stop:674 length:150 start_codon:yes stop_codon:yes gene_type:complete
MKYLNASKRSMALFGIGMIAIIIGIISKRVISYPAGGCMKGGQELTFNI